MCLNPIPLQIKLNILKVFLSFFLCFFNLSYEEQVMIVFIHGEQSFSFEGTVEKTVNELA